MNAESIIVFVSIVFSQWFPSYVTAVACGTGNNLKAWTVKIRPERDYNLGTRNDVCLGVWIDRGGTHPMQDLILTSAYCAQEVMDANTRYVALRTDTGWEPFIGELHQIKRTAGRLAMLKLTVPTTFLENHRWPLCLPDSDEDEVPTEGFAVRGTVIESVAIPLYQDHFYIQFGTHERFMQGSPYFSKYHGTGPYVLWGLLYGTETVMEARPYVRISEEYLTLINQYKRGNFTGWNVVGHGQG